jgi:hypothetical protein
MTLVWIFVALCVGVWLLAGWRQRADAGVRHRAVSNEDEEEVALGLIAPIAAELNIGRLTPAQAENQIRQLALIAPTAPALWRSMSPERREEVALDFMRLTLNADFVANVEEQLAPLKESDPDLWEESMAKAKRALGRTPTGGEGR